jgi:hypothetical protein
MRFFEKTAALALYWVMAGVVKAGRLNDFLEYLKSAELLFKSFPKEVKYLDTYIPVLGTYKYTYEMWFQIESWGSLDILRDSGKLPVLQKGMFEFIDGAGPHETRFLRTAGDINPEAARSRTY